LTFVLAGVRAVTLMPQRHREARHRLSSKTTKASAPAPANSRLLGVLRKPNHFQNRIKFIEHWMLSKLAWGNVYALKERDARGIVSALYILDPQLVTPLVTPSGDVYYKLEADHLLGGSSSITSQRRRSSTTG
jgi:phage portal protein BeeE